MANDTTRANASGHTGQLVGGIVASFVAFVTLVLVLVKQGQGAAWAGAQTGLLVGFALAAAVASWCWNSLLAPVLEPQEGRRPAWVGTVGLLAAHALVAVLLLLLAGAGAGAAWGKSQKLLAVLALALVVALVAIWRQPLKAWFSARGTLLQLNAGLVTVLVLGVVFLLNYFIVPRRLGWIKKDFTEAKYYTLAEQTINVLKSVTKEKPVELIAMLSTDQFAGAGSHVIKQRLNDFGKQSAYVKVTIWDPNLDYEAKKLYEEGVVSALPAVIARYKDEPQTREVVTGAEEKDITKALLKLLSPSSRKVYVLSGHGELDPDSADPANGMANFKTVLETDRYELAKLELFKQAAVPSDAAALLIARPKSAPDEKELQKIEAWLAGGGRLLLCLDPDDKSGFGKLAEKYGIVFHRADVLDQMQIMFGGDPQLFQGMDYGEHETVSFFKNVRQRTVFFGAGYLTQQTAAGDYQLTDLIKTSASSFAQEITAPAKPGQPAAQGARTNGPLTVAMLSSTKDPEPPKDEPKDAAKAPEPEKTRIRVAVFADGDFLANQIPANQFINLNVAGNIVAWLTDNTKALGIRAKDPSQDMENRKITADAKTIRWIVILTLFLPVLLIFGAGVAVQIARR
ncbi:MAG: GldG family protein [Fimbriimonadaceae bacterium]|nr:GldG family protein [Fimbriimonadaceae bacterium]